MPQVAVHKSKDKKPKGAIAAKNEYNRRLRSLDEDESIPIGRITKVLRADRFTVSYYETGKKQIVEVQARVVDRNIQRLKPNIGNFIVPVEASKNKFEVYLVLTDEDARRRSERIPKNILNFSFSGTSEVDDVAIEFNSDEEDEVEEKEEEKKIKKEKVSKHVERVVREEVDVEEKDVNIDDI